MNFPNPVALRAAANEIAPIIRPAIIRDIPEIERLNVAAYREYRSVMPSSVFSSYMSDLRSLAEHWGEANILVAEVEGSIAGSVNFYTDASTEGLGLPKGLSGFRKLAVRPGMRGKGIGRKLVEACILAARASGAGAVIIHTVEFMRTARGMYEEMGFERCPAFDVHSAGIGLGDPAETMKIMAYQLDLGSSRVGPSVSATKKVK